MASARKRGTRWTALYRDAGGHQKSAGTYDDERTALKAAQRAEALANPVVPVDAQPATRRGKVTVAAYAPQWLAALSLEPNTRATYNNSVKHIVKVIGGVPVADVTPDGVRKVHKHLERLGRADSTRHHVNVVMYLIFEAASRAGMRDLNPCDGIKVRIKDQREMMTVTPAQARLIEDAIDPDYRLLVRALFATGCRWSEMIAVKGTDVERHGNGYVLKIRRTVNETWQVGLYEKPYGKSVKAIRDISIQPSLARELMKYGDQLCFTNSKRTWLRRSDFRQRVWKPAVTRVGLPRLRVHDTRHSAISWWANAGIPLAAVRDRAGHSNITTTSRYIHHQGDDPFMSVFGEAA